MSTRPVSVASDVDCLANTKDSLIPVGFNKTSKKAMLLCTRLWQNLECSCVFADIDAICQAANVSVSEEEVSSPLHLCSEHYYATYSYCRCVSECALCQCVW